MNFIKLTSIIPAYNGKPPSVAYIRTEAIEAIYTDGETTTIGIKSHNNGGFRCKESAEEVLRRIANMEEPE